MRKNSSKIYMEEGIKYRFNEQQLRASMSVRKSILKSSDVKATLSAITEELADAMYVSPEAVKNWMYGYNGPSDMEQIKIIADFFDEDYHRFLIMEEGNMLDNNKKENSVKVITEAQRDYTKKVVREIYQDVYRIVELLVEDYYVDDKRETYDFGYVSSYSVFDYYSRVVKRLGLARLDVSERFYNRLKEFLEGTLIFWAIVAGKIESGEELAPENAWLVDYVKTKQYEKDITEIFSEYMV